MTTPTTDYTVPDVYYAVMWGAHWKRVCAEAPAERIVRALRVVEAKYWDVDDWIRDRFDAMAAREDVAALLLGLAPDEAAEKPAGRTSPRARLSDTARVTFNALRPKGERARPASWYVTQPDDWEQLHTGIRQEWTAGHGRVPWEGARLRTEAALAAVDAAGPLPYEGDAFAGLNVARAVVPGLEKGRAG